MPTLYRVEKDGISFHIQPEMVEYYADNGYSIYKTVEEKVTNVKKELKNYTPETSTAYVGVRGGDNGGKDSAE